MYESELPEDIESHPQTKRLDIVSPLPVLFLCSVLFIAVLNMSNFFSSYKTAIEEKPNDKQVALSSIEGKYTDSFTGKTNYVDINGLFSRIAQKNSLNNVIFLKNGHLAISDKEIDQSTNISNVHQFQLYLEEKNIPYAFILAPDKLATDFDEMYPAGFSTFVNQNSDQLVQGLRAENIPTLDLRESMVEQNIDFYDFFPKTDGHWNIEGAFFAHTEISKFIDCILGENYSEPMFWDLGNYDISVIKNIWLGGWGSRTGIFTAGVDNFTKILPNFDTSFRFEVPNLGIDRMGTFQEALTDETVLEHEDLPSEHPYYYYLLLNTFMRLTNYNSSNKISIFIIRDSFSSTMAPFLSLHYKNTFLYDMRTGSQEDLLAKIEKYQPDLVLQMVSAAQLQQPKHFNYLTTEAIESLNH